MNKLKQQISELRGAMPRYVQWLLLAAAFIVVLILLTLLLTRGGNDADVAAVDETPVSIEISNDAIDWAETRVGERQTASIKISASAPAHVSVRMSKVVAGFNARNTCNNMGTITPQIPCTITLEYAPTTAMDVTPVPLFIDYWAGAEELKDTDRIMVTLGAIAPEPQPTFSPEPKPVVQPTYEPEPLYGTEPSYASTPATPVQTTVIREIESIAPSDPFASYQDFEPKITFSKSEPEYEPAPESCSDFAFPGYNASGNQIGWIRPERGAYYFHPFSDKNCDKPTGIYNPDNGIITDIKNSGKKIGTDADHIGRTIISTNGELPALNDAPRGRNNAMNDVYDEPVGTMARMSDGWSPMMQSIQRPAPSEDILFATTDEDVVTSTPQYDRSFILRQYKPIPATIVSDVRADVVLGQNQGMINFPVRATVDRNVYADNGRTVIIPTGTLLLGYVTGEVPGPYKSIGRMQIKWYQFVLPNGVEFNFEGDEDRDPFSGDAQGRVGVPGRGSTDYLEQFVMPMLTAIVPAAVNMIAPIADRFVNQIDLDNNTVVQSGTVRSSELAKNEIITAWNQVAQKLMVDMMDNTVPPFTIPAGTRITVYSPVDLQVSCGEPGGENARKCAVGYGNQRRVAWGQLNKRAYPADDDSWIGQVRSFDWGKYCDKDGNVTASQEELNKLGVDYRNLLFYCKSSQYQAINNVRQDVLYQQAQQQYKNKYNYQSDGGGVWNGNNSGSSLTGITTGNDAFMSDILGLEQNDDGYWQLPVETPPVATADVLTCLDGSAPDGNGCCAGEIYTDMGDQGFNCCPETGGDCFPPIL